MTSKLISCITFCIIAFSIGYANPLPTADIVYVNAYPPEIGVWTILPVDVSGDTIYTSSGYAIINQGIMVPDNWGLEPFIFDSSNTGGFILNPEADSVQFSTVIDPPDPARWLSIYYGYMGMSPPPIRGHYVDYDNYYEGRDTLVVLPYPIHSFSFSIPDFGYTNVVLNEISTHCTWYGYHNFIELYNKTDQAISLSGWKLVCDTIYEFPSEAVIGPYGFYTVTDDVLPASFDLDYAADNIYLINPNPDWILEGNRRVDQAGWSSDHGENVSLIRYPDGNADSSAYSMSDFRGYNDNHPGSFTDGFPTPGAPNTIDTPGLIVFGVQAIDTSNTEVHLVWINPAWEPDYESTIVTRNSDHFPLSHDDGETIYTGTATEFIDDNFAPSAYLYYTIFARTTGDEYSIPTDESRVRVYGGTCYSYFPGDVNMFVGGWPPQVIGSDVTYLVGYFRGLNQPCLLGDPGSFCSADANGDCQVIGSDVTKLVSYFRGLTQLSHCADYPPAWSIPADCPEEAPMGWPNCEQ